MILSVAKFADKKYFTADTLSDCYLISLYFRGETP